MPTELENLPGEGPATLPRVRAFLRYKDGDTDDDDELDDKVQAVNALVRCWPCSVPAQGAEAFPSNVVTGATMMAARLFRRRESPAGVVAFGDAGALYVMRNDPDVAMLLGLGSWASPGLG
jgi:hypothetical protein